MVWTGQAVLVTGAGRGMGFAIAKRFLESGARVALNDISTDRLASSLGRLTTDLDSDRVMAVAGDVSTVAGCESAVKQTVKAFGRLDVLVNNAGVFRTASLADTDEALWNLVVDVGLKGAFFCTRASAPMLRETKGSVINISSELGLRGVAGRSAYCAAKGGLTNLTRALALELAPEIRVNAIAPGTIDTEMTRESAEEVGDLDLAYRQWASIAPLNRIGLPEEVAAAVQFLAGSDAAFITGAILSVDGGCTAGR